MSDNDGYHGTQRPGDGTDQYNALTFVIRQVLNGRHHVALVKVVAVTAPRGLALAGTVDVQPLVNQLDGQGSAVPHGVVNDIPYLRVQGGADAVIIDPKEGDIGLCIFCDRDISAVKATRDAANPGSLRRSDMADGVYLGGVLNAIPSQYVLFSDAGIKMVSPTNITLQAPEIDLVAPVVNINASSSATINTPTFTVNGATHLNGDTSVTGDASVSGTVTAPVVAGTTDVTFGGKSAGSHKHSGVSAGTAQTGTPV